MRLSTIVVVVTAVFCLGSAASTQADWVELSNRDVVQGEIISLDESELKLRSENFGEMTIPRERVSLIGLGERPVPSEQPPRGAAAGTPGAAAAAPGTIPSLQSPQLNQLLQQALGGGGRGNLQQNLDQTRRGLEDLKQDLGPGPSADALDSYIKMFRMFGEIAPQQGATPGAQNEPPSRPAGRQGQSEGNNNN